jgi:hypothetical protein
MIIEKPIHAVDIDDKGQPIFSMCATEADMDWMRAGRLSKQAKNGDQEAAKELERMNNSVLVKRREV